LKKLPEGQYLSNITEDEFYMFTHSLKKILAASVISTAMFSASYAVECPIATEIPSMLMNGDSKLHND